jgi:hypothetical protein
VYAREPFVAIQVEVAYLINQAALDIKRGSRVCNDPTGHYPGDERGCLELNVHALWTILKVPAPRIVLRVITMNEVN